MVRSDSIDHGAKIESSARDLGRLQKEIESFRVLFRDMQSQIDELKYENNLLKNEV